MKILAIETSCDDTCVALASQKGDKFLIEKEIISSQTKIHQKWGGVYPTAAKREHQKNIVPIIEKILKNEKRVEGFSFSEKKLTKIETFLAKDGLLKKRLLSFLNNSVKPKIDLIAVTKGPGLEPCLWVGVNTAKSLSYFWNVPIVGVNHIEAHILINFLKDGKILDIKKYMPAVCLVVSGGHTQLILMKDLFDYQIIGETRDDAAGEAFDKTARVLGLSYPGGPAIEKLISKYRNVEMSRCRDVEMSKCRNVEINLPRPMIHSKNFDFSFSGLKTAVLYFVKKQPRKIRKSKIFKVCLAKEIQNAIVEVLVKKTIRAAREFRAKSIILGGGVSANSSLRSVFKKKIMKNFYQLNFLVPEKKFSTDNASMVAFAGYLRFRKFGKDNWKNLEADANLIIGT